MTQPEPIAIVGISAIMPDAPTAQDFWSNIRGGRYSISDVPTDRWDPELYYDADPYTTEDKTYSRIGGWVREFPWEPMAWKLPIPPSVAAHFDEGQMWSVSAARSALLDAGWPDWGVDSDRVGRDPRQCARGRQVRAHDPAHRLPGVRPGAERSRRRSRHCRPTSRQRSGPRPASGSSPTCRRSPRTPCPVSCRTSWPAGSRPCSTCAARTSPPTPPAPRRWPGMSAADRRAAGPSLRRLHLRGHRPQHGTRRLRALLQDRCPVRDRDPSVRRGRRRLRDGRGRSAVRPQAALGRREGRGPRVRGHPGHRRLVGRQGQGHHRAQPDRPEARGPPGVGERRRRSGLHRDARGARDVHPCRRRHRARRPRRDLRRPRRGTRVDRPGLGQVQHRPPEGRGRRRGRVQGRDEPERQGPAPEPELQRPQPERGLGLDPVPRQHRAARVDPVRVRIPGAPA